MQRATRSKATEQGPLTRSTKPAKGAGSTSTSTSTKPAGEWTLKADHRVHNLSMTLAGSKKGEVAKATTAKAAASAARQKKKKEEDEKAAGESLAQMHRGSILVNGPSQMFAKGHWK